MVALYGRWPLTRVSHIEVWLYIRLSHGFQAIMKASVPLTNYGDLLPIDTMSDAVFAKSGSF